MTTSKILNGKLLCRSCGNSHHETTLKYSPDEPANGTMLTLQERFGPRGWNWQSFPENDPAIRGADLTCPWCGSVYFQVHENIDWYLRGEHKGRGADVYRELYQANLVALKKELSAAAKAAKPATRKRKK